MDKIKEKLLRLNHDFAIEELRLQQKLSKQNSITYNDILYLDIIEAYSGKYTASMLADILNVSKPALTQKINELEKKGFIKKVKCSSDKRASYLHIVDNDQDTLIKRESDEKLYHAIKSRFSEAEIDTFCEVVDIISKTLNNIEGE